MFDDNELKAQPIHALASVEQLLPHAVDAIDWLRNWAVNWRRH